MSRSMHLKVNSEQEHAIRGLFAHYGWELQEEFEGNCHDNIVADSLLNDSGITTDVVAVPRDSNCSECESCLCQPCVTTSWQEWLGEGQRPSVLNAGVRKRIYKKYWTMLDRRGAWKNERYLSKKAELMQAVGVVVTKRQEARIMDSSSEENGLLVFGVPSDINSSLAERKLMIHFQKTAVSGGAEVDRVTVSSTHSNAYEVYFQEDQDAARIVLQQQFQTIDFGGEQFICTVIGFPNQHQNRRDRTHEEKHTGSYKDEEKGKPQEASNAPANIKCMITLKEAEIKQLEMCDFVETVKQTFPNLAMTLRPGTASIDLHGPSIEIERCKLMVYEHLRELPIARIAPPSSPAVMSFLKSLKGESLVREYFRNYQIRACYFVDNGDVMCSGISKEETDRAKAFLAREIVESRVNLEDKAVTVAKTAKFSEIIRKLEELNECLSIDITRHGTVVLVGKDTSVSVAMDGVQTYILCNQEIEQFVPLEAGRLRFLCDMKEGLLNFEQTSGRHSVKIEVQRGVDQCGVKVIGVKHEVDGAVQVLRNMFDKIVKRRHEVDNPGMQQIFKDRDKTDYLRLIEVDCNCVIEVTKERPSLSDDRKNKKSTLRKDPEHSVNILLKHTTKDGRRIVVAKGDITKLQVDAIATTAKRDFGSVSGLFKTIQDAGGREIQSDCQELLRANNGTPFVIGQAVSTRPGKITSCARVIHVFGPEWDKDAERSVVDSLADSIEACLREADKHTCRTVAIPLIGVEEFGVPLDLCVNTIVMTINEFWTENQERTSITKIFLIEQMRSRCKAFADAVRSVYNVENEVIENSEYQEERESQKIRVHRSRSVSSVPKLPPFANTMTYIDKTRVMTPEGKNVNLIFGNMATQKVDLMVNSIGKELDLTAGAASKAIYTVAGQQLKHELSAVTRGRPPKDGDTYVTGGGNLSAKHVIHVICCTWGSNRPEQTLRGILQECFRIADLNSASSIAFPAIGTGNLGFPRDLVAKVMYEEAEIFSRRRATSTLTDINFVVYDLDHPTKKSFSKEVQKYASAQPTSPGSPAAVEKMRGHEREGRSISMSHGAHATGNSDVLKANPLKDEQLYKDLYLHGNHEWQMSVGSIRVHVINGDITNETMDCVEHR
ncbi:protein mono-ADP-ribosyltransferase PARP14-like [Ptychodera flava]|uniref:protein mono-ADP-ribosyltransferase PARP14-like n=1 Tax=Ptychodera flava TaxID=63121 RepID=UPI00396A2FD8